MSVLARSTEPMRVRGRFVKTPPSMKELPILLKTSEHSVAMSEARKETSALAAEILKKLEKNRVQERASVNE